MTKDEVIATVRQHSSSERVEDALYYLWVRYSDSVGDVFGELISLVISGKWPESYLARQVLGNLDSELPIDILNKARQDLSEALVGANPYSFRFRYVKDCLAIVDHALDGGDDYADT